MKFAKVAAFMTVVLIMISSGTGLAADRIVIGEMYTNTS